MRNEIYKIVVISADNIVSLNSANLSNSNIRRFLVSLIEDAFLGVRRLPWYAGPLGQGLFAEGYPQAWPSALKLSFSRFIVSNISYIQVPLGYHGPKHRFARAFRNLRLLRVSKEIYKEAAHLFYKQTFQFHSAATLQTFLLQQRSETMSRLRHIDVTVAENEWNLVPGVSAQLAELVNIEKLSIHGLNHKTSGRDFPKHLSQTGRSISEWDLSLESYDKALGIKLARDTYPFLFPFYRKVIHDRGVDQLLAILDMHVCERVRTVWHSIGWALWRREQPLITRYKDVAETEERRKVRDAAVGEEIIRLLVSDC